MKKSISLTVAQPCTENWDTFKPAKNGRHCQKCDTMVVDFTTMSDDEIIAYFRKKPAQTCGRLRTDQLKTYPLHTPPVIRPGITILKAGLVSLALTVMYGHTAARPVFTIPPTQEQTIPAHREPININTATAANQIISGFVKSEEDNQPLPGVSIVLKNTDIGTVTDADGKFQFPQALQEGDVLIFSYIGFETIEYTVQKQESKLLNINMALSSIVLMGKIQVDGPYQPKTSFVNRCWTKVKNAL